MSSSTIHLTHFKKIFKKRGGHPDRLQKWLAMIADVNDPVIAETAADDETLARIRTEIRSMAQDKEVQNMLTQEMFERMDWASYGEEREEGRHRGRYAKRHRGRRK